MPMSSSAKVTSNSLKSSLYLLWDWKSGVTPRGNFFSSTFYRYCILNDDMSAWMFFWPSAMSGRLSFEFSIFSLESWLPREYSSIDGFNCMTILFSLAPRTSLECVAVPFSGVKLLLFYKSYTFPPEKERWFPLLFCAFKLFWPWFGWWRFLLFELTLFYDFLAPDTSIVSFLIVVAAGLIFLYVSSWFSSTS